MSGTAWGRRWGAVAACGVVAAASAANGAIVRYVNDGTFVWEADDPFNGVFGTGLDVTQGPDQSGDLTDRTIGWNPADPVTSGDVASAPVFGAADVRVVRSFEEVVVIGEFGDENPFNPPEEYEDGEAIGPGENFQSSATMFAFGFAIGYFPFLGDEGTIGLEIDLPGGTHYGYVELEWTGTGTLGYQPTALAWETEPGVAIVVPGPASVATAIALAPLVLRRRRR